MNLLLDPAGLFNCLPIVAIAVRDHTRPADCIDGSHTLEGYRWLSLRIKPIVLTLLTWWKRPIHLRRVLRAMRVDLDLWLCPLAS